MKIQIFIWIVFLLLTGWLNLEAQVNEGYSFKKEIDLPVTPVKNQGRSGTCWAFSTTSFIEAEILRMTGKEYDISEMYFVYNTYLNKARQYVRFHGNTKFGEGGQAHDLLNVLPKYGMVREDDYSGKKDATSMHNHNSLEKGLNDLIEPLVNEDKINTNWILKADSILKSELGPLPKSTKTEAGNISPSEFYTKSKFNPDNYVEITSFSHHPYYTQFVLEVPDNWALEKYYNVPLDDLITIMNYSLSKGYTLVWDGDVSEPSFSSIIGVAVMPDVDWSKIDPVMSRDILSKPTTEIDVTAELRQKSFDDYATTDDHLMHITGIAKDQNGNTYYLTKNSGGKDSSPYDGYIYMSEAYVKMKTIAITVNKEAIPKELALKMGLD
ncbi:MAG: aminopeptidase [Bacteroidales bacterium]|nr:aminopeptidase [Bacteroidales bacterium]